MVRILQTAIYHKPDTVISRSLGQPEIAKIVKIRLVLVHFNTAPLPKLNSYAISYYKSVTYHLPCSDWLYLINYLIFWSE